MKIGIIGCGQLARMLAHAAHKLNIETCFAAEPGESIDCVKDLGAISRMQQNSTGVDLYRALGGPDVITVEREQVDINLLKQLQACCPVHPNPDSIEQAGNRLLERSLLVGLELPISRYIHIRTFADILEALPAFNYPVFVKSSTQGYDGKGQWRLFSRRDLPIVKREFNSQPCILEQGINFKGEVSIIGARSADGEIRFFPLVENHHRNGVLLASFVPVCDAFRKHEQTARNYLAKILEALDYVGVLCIEMFVTEDGLVINEIAPRVHNSGHWTMDGCSSSQFEQHVRAITGQPLAPIQANGSAAMINVLGSETPVERFFHASATRHSYNKKPREGRKLGHLNFSGKNRSEVRNTAENLMTQLYYRNEDERAVRVVNQ